MKNIKSFCMLFVLILFLTLSACSGGSVNTSTTVTGQLQASYINGAKICVADSTLGTAAEHCDTTKNQGNFSLTNAVRKDLAVLIDTVQVGTMPADQVAETTIITPAAMSAGNAEKAQRITDIFHQAGSTTDNQTYDMGALRTADINAAALFAFIGGTANTLSIGGRDVTYKAVGSYTISGEVTLSGAGLSGVTITLIGASDSTNSRRNTTTDRNGNYSFENLPDGSYTTTPSLRGYTFDPPIYGVSINGFDFIGSDFTATQQ